MNESQELPGELAATAAVLRERLADLPSTPGADLDEVVRTGRRHVVRRTAAVAGALGAAAVAVLVAGLGSGVDRATPQPAGPVPEATATVEVRRQSVTAVYGPAEEALTDVLAAAGRQPGRVAWDVGNTVLYGHVLVAVDPGEDEAAFEMVTVPGFPKGGYGGEEASALVAAGDGDGLWVRTARADGGLPTTADYCAWWSFPGSNRELDCEQVGTVDGGRLLRLDGGDAAVFVWDGGQVEVHRQDLFRLRLKDDGSARPGADELTWEHLAGLVTDPRLRWGA